MESTGEKNKIHISEETARLIRKASHKDIWTTPRQDLVEAKGKGKLSTHWLSYNNNHGSRSVSSSSGTRSASALSGPDHSETQPEISEVDYTQVDYTESEADHTITAAAGIMTMPPEVLEDSRQKKLDRSIDWVVHSLLRLLKRVVAMRGGIEKSIRARTAPMPSLPNDTSPLEEVIDIIELPNRKRQYPVYPSQVELPPQVVFQLRDFVKTIASMYRENPFHSFEHAIHVTQSVTKLLTRVVTPANVSTSTESDKLHQYTYGITSDPLAQFAVAFSALIHDVDHPGVANATLVQEQSQIALTYKNKSVAEQNSVDVAWELLSEPIYADLRSCIFTSQSEFRRFRQLVVNSVMATDIVDQELGSVRKKRWEAAFVTPSSSSTEPGDEEEEEEEARMDANRKATIVIEHLIQSSDVAHTMQHWHVYAKWNQRFFNECYKGFVEGRTTKDPSEVWFLGELGFFDHYVIPLAKKLKECQVFGVASDEYLQYAEANRREWNTKGQEMVQSYVTQYKHYYAAADEAELKDLSNTGRKDSKESNDMSIGLFGSLHDEDTTMPMAAAAATKSDDDEKPCSFNSSRSSTSNKGSKKTLSSIELWTICTDEQSC